uniref:Uncharacterized protein n=1 Tax=Glossina pallidipes TaxID=7398 RepID=A0A1B0A8Q1_GLOPL
MALYRTSTKHPNAEGVEASTKVISWLPSSSDGPPKMFSAQGMSKLELKLLTQCSQIYRSTLITTPVLTSEASHGISTIIKNRIPYHKLREKFRQIHSGFLQFNDKNSRLPHHIEPIGSLGCVKATLLESIRLKTVKMIHEETLHLPAQFFTNSIVNQNVTDFLYQLYAIMHNIAFRTFSNHQLQKSFISKV